MDQDEATRRFTNLDINNIPCEFIHDFAVWKYGEKLKKLGATNLDWHHWIERIVPDLYCRIGSRYIAVEAYRQIQPKTLPERIMLLKKHVNEVHLIIPNGYEDKVKHLGVKVYVEPIFGPGKMAKRKSILVRIDRLLCERLAAVAKTEHKSLNTKIRELIVNNIGA